MSIRHVVFDIDGTLLSSVDANIYALQETMETVTGKRMSYEECAFATGHPGRECLRILGVADVDNTLRMWETNLIKYIGWSKPYPGIEDLLLALERRGYHLGVITSRTRYQLDWDFTKWPAGKAFPVILCADEVTRPKPNPDPLLEYMRLTGAKPEEVLYIGDTENDNLCARSAGARFALATWGAIKKDIPADFVPREPGDLISCLENADS